MKTHGLHPWVLFLRRSVGTAINVGLREGAWPRGSDIPRYDGPSAYALGYPYAAAPRLGSGREGPRFSGRGETS
jgi:hypothetical protein